MKKVFSVGICIFLMLSLAFAAGFVPVGTKESPWVEYPGESINIPPDCFALPTGEGIPMEVDFSGRYFKITAKIIKGNDMVENVTFADDRNVGQVLKINLYQNYQNDVGIYTNRNPSYSNLVISELSVEAKQNVRDGAGNTILSKGKKYYFNQDGKFYGQIGYPYSSIRG